METITEQLHCTTPKLIGLCIILFFLFQCIVYDNQVLQIRVPNVGYMIFDILPRIQSVGFWNTGVECKQARLISTLPPDNALPALDYSKQPELVFFLQLCQAMRTPDFTPSDSIFPVKLDRLQLLSTEARFTQLLLKTSYSKCVGRYEHATIYYLTADKFARATSHP